MRAEGNKWMVVGACPMVLDSYRELTNTEPRPDLSMAFPPAEPRVGYKPLVNGIGQETRIHEECICARL